MADTKLSDLTAATSATVADLFYIVDGTTSKQITFDNLQKSITNVASIASAGDIATAIDKYIYIGTESSDGSWRFRISGTSLLVEKRESGNWNEKGAFTA